MVHEQHPTHPPCFRGPPTQRADKSHVSRETTPPEQVIKIRDNTERPENSPQKGRSAVASKKLALGTAKDSPMHKARVSHSPHAQRSRVIADMSVNYLGV